MNPSNRLLVVRTDNGWEMPGGGWEHDESFEDCIKREVDEELGVTVKSHSGILAVYRGRNVKNYMSLRILIKAELDNLDITPKDADILETSFVTKEELLVLEMSDDESPIKDFTALIWLGQ